MFLPGWRRHLESSYMWRPRQVCVGNLGPSISMHKTHSKTLEMALKRLHFSKFPGEHAAGHLEVLAFMYAHVSFLAGGVNTWAGVLFYIKFRNVIEYLELCPVVHKLHKLIFLLKTWYSLWIYILLQDYTMKVLCSLFYRIVHKYNFQFVA